jgi:putative MATE family efflux protein
MIISAVIIGSVILIFNSRLLSLIFGNIEPEVMDNAEIYMTLSALSYPFLAAYNAGAALFRSMGKSKVSMYISVLMNAVNIGGNALLIFGLDMGVAGAGTATLLSHFIGSVIIIALICSRHNTVYIEKIWRYRPDFATVRRILSIGIPNGIENGMFHIGKILVLSLVSTFGTASIAANAICNTVASFANIPGTAIGLGIITVVGRCMGAGEKDQAVYYSKRMIALIYCSVAVINTLIFLLAPNVVGLFGLSEEAELISVEVLRLFAVANTLIWTPSFAVPNVLRAAGDARFTMIVSIVSMWVFRVGSSYAFSWLGMGLQGVWIAMYCDWICRGSCFVARFISGKWKNIKVI